MEKLYMAYGSNLNLNQMALRCPTAKPFRSTMLEGYQLIFSGVATIIPCEESRVPVAVWKIDSDCERALDRYEGYPWLYRKEYLPVCIDSEWYEPMIYIMNRFAPKLPCVEYYNIISDGYNDVGFDIEYLKQAIEVTEKYTKPSKNFV